MQHMMTESDIFDVTPETQPNDGAFYDYNTLKTTAYASLHHALKRGKRFIIKTTKDNSERHRAMLRREYELSIGCDHPHIVHTYTYEENLPMGEGIVMEYIDGRTLGEYLAERPSPSERRRIYNELLSAIGYLHKRGIIHNDLKPENILISYANDSVKLIDFGLADSDAEYAMTRLGCTAKYASPELQSRSKNIDARSDIYSLGILLKELFGHRYAYIVHRCTKQDPAKRFKSVDKLQYALRWHSNIGKMALGIALIIAILLPIVLRPTTKVETSSVVVERDMPTETIEPTETTEQVETTDSIATHTPTPPSTPAKVEAKAPTISHSRALKNMESEIGRICLAALDSVKCAPYKEFGGKHIMIMWERLESYKERMLAEANNSELRAQYISRYDELTTQYVNLLYNHMDNLPSFYNEESPEARLYYNTLILNNLPYKPYQNKDL